MIQQIFFKSMIQQIEASFILAFVACIINFYTKGSSGRTDYIIKPKKLKDKPETLFKWLMITKLNYFKF